MLLLLTLLAAFPPENPSGAVDAALIAVHNRERAGHKLPPLVAEARLTEAARVHAADMAAHETMSHEGTDKSTPADRVKRQGYPYLSTGENVAKGQRTVEEVMTAWMESPHHRDNILGDFTQIGVARVDAEDGTPYWCVEFGCPFPRLDPAKAEAEVAERLNKARADAEKPALRVDPKLADAARSIALALAARGVLRPKEGETPNALPTLADRLKTSGYRFRTVAESNASGSPTPEAVLASLLGSESQKATALGDYADLGVGYALADDGRPFWCLLLAKPLTP